MQLDKSIYTYLALGDSYTIGQSVSRRKSFPYQLRQQLKLQNIRIKKTKMIARTGWTSGELIQAIKTENIQQKFNFVTLLIGVNNQYRGNSKTIYREEFSELLNNAIQFADGRKDRVFVLSIPDYGVTFFGQRKNANLQISKEIDAFNIICKEETTKQEAIFVNITPISRMAQTDPSLVASDNLHPSEKMYALWNEILIPKILRTLNNNINYKKGNS